MIKPTGYERSRITRATKPYVVIVDDDEGVRHSLSSLLRSVDLDVLLFDNPAAMLASSIPDAPGCIILDVRLPGVSGLDFQGQLAESGIKHPIIFMTGHGDISMSVRAMKAGAVDFLAKPFRDQDMVDAVMAAISRDTTRRKEVAMLDGLRTEYETLTSREREVMAYVAAGLMNKQIAGIIGLSEITVKIHRGNVMKKMAVRTVADLVRKAEALGISRPDPTNKHTNV